MVKLNDVDTFNILKIEAYHVACKFDTRILNVLENYYWNRLFWFMHSI